MFSKTEMGRKKTESMQACAWQSGLLDFLCDTTGRGRKVRQEPRQLFRLNKGVKGPRKVRSGQLKDEIHRQTTKIAPAHRNPTILA